MKLVNIKNVAGRELYINPDAVCYVSIDLMNTELVQIHMNNQDFHIVKAKLTDIIRLLKYESN